MTFRALILRGLCHHWRAHLGVTLGAAIGSAAMIGALGVGDSVKGSLRERALDRLGRIEWAMPTGDRFPREKLASDLSEAFVGGVIPALQLSGVATCEGQTRANNVQILGVNASFWKLARTRHAFTNALRGGLAINSSLAAQLEAKPGQEVLLRIKKPAALSGDASLASKSGVSVTLRLPVLAVVPDSQLGAFSLQGAQGPPLTAFVQLEELQRAVELAERANLFLIGHTEDTTTSHWPNAELASRWRLADASVELRAGPDYVEMHTRRVFLDQPLALCSLSSVPDSRPIFTYLVNLLHADIPQGGTTPYSMVTAAGPPWTPADLRDDEIVVSQWLADDLRVKAGDEIALSYFDPESGARLIERTNTFRVCGVVPMEMPWADRTLMPEFPGIEKAERTSDWDAGFPLTYKIRQQDEDYWKQFRGTPKAFITLAAGQKMWGNRFGNLTAIRFPIPTNAIPLWEGRATIEPPKSAEEYRLALERSFLRLVRPEEVGLRFEPVREQALKTAEQSQDFGGLFLGFSLFLIAAALLLMAMLFQLSLEQRAPEIGTLLALGFTPREVRKLLLGEGAALAFFGGVLGALGGLAYANIMLHGLATVWRDAVGATALNFHVTAQTLAIGLCASTGVSVATIWLALRKFVRRDPRELLAGEVEAPESSVRSPKAGVVAMAAFVSGLALIGWTLAKGDTANAGGFFGAGALVLIAGLGFVGAWLSSALRTSCPQNHPSTATSEPHMESDLPAGRRQHVSLSSLALHGCARRRKRSLATVAMLACGSFLIVSIGVFRLDANRDATQRSSGTGGFALIGESTMPVVQDLNSSAGRDFFALKEEDLKGVSFVPFRVREGDEASCLNLNRAQKPRLLGVKPELLEGRFTFASMVHGPPRGLNWQLLKRPPEPWSRDGDVPLVPAIGDANSVRWALGKKLGDTIEFRDAQGRPFKVWIVATVANSILQGQLLIDEAEFVQRFPDESGYRQFLIDAPTNLATEVSTTLSRAMQDAGLELTPAAQRLAQFNAVQNTYLGTFQVLGGLGLLLGSVGLGIVVLRNVLERRGELAVLLAVGFRKPQLQRLLLIENGALLALGLTVGVIAAAVAVMPALLSPGTQLPWLTLTLTLAAVLLNGVLWTWAATRAALRGDLLAALRNE